MTRRTTPHRTSKTAAFAVDDPSRRTLLAAALALPMAGAMAMVALRRANSAEKVSKEEANYRGQPNGEQMCAGCGHYRAPDGCEKVEGKISPQGWCKYWEKH